MAEMMQEVVDNLGLDMDYKALRESITVTNPEDTRILQLSVTNSDPEIAKAIVDELASVSSQYIGDKMEVVPPKIIEEGEIPTVRTSPSMKKNALFSFTRETYFTSAKFSINISITIFNY